MSREFYIIGHNPNTIGEATEYLKLGANAIEPDICYDAESDQKFHVHEILPEPLNLGQEPCNCGLSLKNYLITLKDVLRANQDFNLSLIAFDLKPPYSYDINDLYNLIRSSFSDDYPNVKILTTVSQPEAMDFLGNLNNQGPNEIVGVDEHCSPNIVQGYFRKKKLKYMFGSGSSFFSPVLAEFTDRIRIALAMRGNNGFKMVYSWAVNNESDMRTYLNIGGEIDGMVTDKVGRLRNLLLSDEYVGRFKIADVRSSGQT